eukprot:TRINITY_DN60403_c0_g1_i1.p1 TRINITY_DN60403_c0_g1~~TRINITY_DN60403_c0_g1_i1.p1  ORF type:complete len:478 (-),score=49.03 TRINITY_DN60403_c0_g1_i1:41-1474(-)
MARVRAQLSCTPSGRRAQTKHPSRKHPSWFPPLHASPHAPARYRAASTTPLMIPPTRRHHPPSTRHHRSTHPHPNTRTRDSSQSPDVPPGSTYVTRRRIQDVQILAAANSRQANMWADSSSINSSPNVRPHGHPTSNDLIDTTLLSRSSTRSKNRSARKMLLLEAAAHSRLGLLHERLGEFRQAVLEWKKFVRILEDLGETRDAVKACHRIGETLQKLGEFERAISWHAKCQELAAGRMDDASEFEFETALGRAYRWVGNVDQAAMHHRNALVKAMDMSSLECEAEACAELGEDSEACAEEDCTLSTSSLTHPDLVTPFAERQLQLGSTIGIPAVQIGARNMLGRLAMHHRDFEAATCEFSEALRVAVSAEAGQHHMSQARCAIGIAKGSKLLEQGKLRPDQPHGAHPEARVEELSQSSCAEKRKEISTDKPDQQLGAEHICNGLGYKCAISGAGLSLATLTPCERARLGFFTTTKT